MQTSVMEPKFLDRLRVEYLDTEHWRVIDRFRFRSRVVDSVITVPAGFVTDFASVPDIPVVWSLRGVADRGSAIHDYLYRFALYERRSADDVLYECMSVTGYALSTRWTVWTGVRSGGALSYAPDDPSLDPR